MAINFTICIGTIGAGVWYSSNGGKNWRRSNMNLPFHAEPGEIQIRSLAVSPTEPSTLYAGSEVGIFRSEDKGATWHLIESPMEGSQIWSVVVHPEDPNCILAGTKPPAVFQSRNRGKSWESLSLDLADKCFAGAPKITSILFDPTDLDTVWVGVEVDGVHRTKDSGKTWERLPPLGSDPVNQDVHSLALSLGEQKKLLACTPNGIWTSTDEGDSWELHSFPFFFENNVVSYCRGVAVKPNNPDVIFVCNGDYIPGKIGAIQRTTNGGKTWNPVDLPKTPNSTMYWLATHPADPNIMVANSIFGYLYTSVDGGDTWEKVEREFGEIRALAWVPN